MNPSSEDIPNLVKEFEVTYRRPLRWFQAFVWGMCAVMLAQAVFLPRLHLPRPVTVAMIAGTAAVMMFGVIGFLWWLAPRSPLWKQMRPAARRYMARFLPAMLLYVVIFEAATWYWLRLHPTGLRAVLAALVPAIPVLFAIRAMLLLLREETDEYLRARGLEVWALATVLTLGLCTVWGFLDQFEVVPHLPLWAVFPLWAVCLFPAHILVQKRHA
jgi:hypothetical protein